MGRLILLVGALAAGIAVAAWYYQDNRRTAAPTLSARPDDTNWLDQLYSQNPNESEAAARHVGQLGPQALPAIRATLQNPGAERDRRKAALKAAAILGTAARPALAEVSAALPDPDLTPEAAVALSFMGTGAFPALRDGLSSEDHVVRRESLRSIGKLKDRAPLDSADVVPLLIEGIADEDPGVRAVAATYLGIIHESGEKVVPVLIDALQDSNPDVRRAAAAALGSFGPAAKQALPALRKAAVDADGDVAREAGLTLVTLQPGAATDPKPGARSRRRRR